MDRSKERRPTGATSHIFRSMATHLALYVAFAVLGHATTWLISARPSEIELRSEIATLRTHANELEKRLVHRLFNTTVEVKAVKPESAKRWCFTGAAVGQKTRMEDTGRSHGLVEMTVSFGLKGNSCSEPPLSYDKQTMWHTGGCGLVSAIRGSRRDRDEWWAARRLAEPLAPRESLVHPRGNSPEERNRRAFLEEAASKGSRSDWGVSLSPDGHLLFGVGHRDFGERSQKGATTRATARSVRDLTVRTRRPIDDQWHVVSCVRRRRRPPTDEPTEGKSLTSPHDTAELLIFVDGIQMETYANASSGRAGDANAGNAATTSGGSPGHGGSAPPHALHDAAMTPVLGELFNGCLDDVHVLAKALDDNQVAALARSRLAALRETPSLELGGPAPPPPPPLPPRDETPIPLYFYAHVDNESRVMRDLFVGSLADGPGVVPREWRIEAAQTDQSKRFGTKIELILRALRETQRGAIVIVSDIDVRFFRPIEAAAREYMRDATVDVAFQRDEDRSLQVNLGFMIIRNSAVVEDLFRTTGEVILKNRRGSTGDQRIVNRALVEPWYFGTPKLRWCVLPSEFVTNTVAASQRLDAMYGIEQQDWLMFHANDYGKATISPARAREAKMRMLRDVTSMVIGGPNAAKPRKRWPVQKDQIFHRNLPGD